MEGFDGHLKDPLYANWVRNTLALNIVNSVLQPYVYGELVKLHKSIISRCPAGVTCGSCTWRQAPRCPNGFCNIIKNEIEYYHRHGNPSFNNTNVRDCKSDAWEVAKCFMPLSRGYRECTSSDADFSAIVNIVINCKAFDELVLCDLDNHRNMFSKARTMRKDLMNPYEHKVSEYYLQSNLDLLMSILNNIKNKPTNFTEALVRISELKAGRFGITLEDVLDARSQVLLESGATREYVAEQTSKLRQEIMEGAPIWKVSQHRLIDNFVKASKYSLVKIMESQIDKVKPERCPKHKWNFSKFLDGIEFYPEIQLLPQQYRLALYPDDGVTADIHDLDLFLLCHILSIESIGLLDNNLKAYIRELILIRDKILGNPSNIARTDLEELAECLEEPLRTEIKKIYHSEGIKDDALKLQFVLTSWQQNEDTMENNQISLKALHQAKKEATRIDELERKVNLLLEQLGNKQEIERTPEGHDQGIASQVQLKPKTCDKKEEEQLQANMTSEDELENISIANGGIREFCEQMNLKKAQPFKGSIILKVTCKSIQGLIRFWYSCMDGSVLRALSKVRDDYRNFLGCDTLDFDIVLTKKEVNRCMKFLDDRLFSLTAGISVLEKVPDTQTLVETVPGYSVYGAIKTEVQRTEEETSKWLKIPKDTSEDLKVQYVSVDDDRQISDTDKQEFQVSLAEIGPIIDRKYEELCYMKQETLSLYFEDAKSSSHKSTEKKQSFSKSISKDIRIAVQGSHDFDQLRLNKDCYVDSEKNEDSSSDEESSSLFSDDELIYSSSETENIEERLEGTKRNKDTPETTYPRRQQQVSNLGSKSSVTEVHVTKKMQPRTGPRAILNEDRYNRWKSFLEIESGVMTDPYRLAVIEIENTLDMERLEMSLRQAFDQKTIDQDTIIVVDVQHSDVKKDRQIIIDNLKKYFTMCMKIDAFPEDQVSVGYSKHNISKVLSSVISKRLKRDYQELKTILKDITNDDSIYRTMIREVIYNLRKSDYASFEDSWEKLIELPHVFGVGVSKGVLQIHTVSDEKKQSEKISSLLKSSKYENAYLIVPFETRPQFLRIGQGDQIETKNGAGTLGCFLQDDEDNIYALTAAHVFQFQPDQEKVPVNSNTILGNLELKLSGLYAIDKSMDFALIKVNPDFKSDLIKTLFDDSHTTHIRWEIMTEENQIKRKHPVYKNGFKTKLRYGRLSTNYIRLKDGPVFYVVEDEDGSHEKRFAMNGDSGSVVCQFNKEKKTGIAISLLTLSATPMHKLEGQEPKRVYYTIPLNNIVKELQKKTNKTFRLARLPGVSRVGVSKEILQIHTVSDEEKQSEEITTVPFETFSPIGQGDQIQVKIEGGSLGCFLQDDGDNIYALTAASVFQFQPDQKKVPLKSDTIFGNLELDLSGLCAINESMDFALIKVNPDLKSRLIKNLIDDNHTELRRWKIMTERTEIDLTRPVYKYGFKTKMRYGRLSTDYYRSENGSVFYTIEDKDGSPEKRFAMNGDSGSVVCQFNKRNPKKQKGRNSGIVISLLTLRATQMHKLDGQEPKRVYYTIPLNDIVKELQRRTSTTFRLASSRF